MAQFSALPLWTDAYLADTGHLTTIEHGAYLLLLMTMWRADGTLPNDDKQLARFTRMTLAQWLRIKPTMMQFFKVSSDSITQGRLTDELAFVKQKRGKQSDNARARWLKDKDKGDADAYANQPGSHMPIACHLDAPTPTPLEEDKSSSLLSGKGPDGKPKKGSRKSYTEAFEVFWSIYPRNPNMSKAEAFKEWQKLDDADRSACVAAVPGHVAYLKTEPDLKMLHACRFISQRRFEGYTEAAASPAPTTDADWVRRLTYGRAKKLWSTKKWGPRPGADGCAAPLHLITPEDGAGWREMEAA